MPINGMLMVKLFVIDAWNSILNVFLLIFTYRYWEHFTNIWIFCASFFFSSVFCFRIFHSELNELRKPTSDNVEILRFFKYMRSARDGQDGKNCHNIYKKCSSFTDTDQPAMLTTYNDINKLVQARKMMQ